MILHLLRLHVVFALLLVCSATSARDVSQEYFPPRGDWARAIPESVGVDSDRLQSAIEFAMAEAVTEPKDLAQVIHDSWSPREPDFRILGPTAPREGSSGLIIRHGKIIGEWGDLARVDMTFSAVKSYLSTTTALALRDGLITDTQQPVGELVRDGKFNSPHNQKITWHHLLQQTSDWQGTLWDVPDWADRPDQELDPSEWPNREIHEPGSFFKYNDVRVNLLAYCMLQVWREPLPVVIKREVMDPIGASSTWRWHGYENSWVTLDGQKMQSVSGGGHFGGGLFINTMDHARMGLLFLRNGRWADRQIIQPEWIEMMRQPTDARPDYGYMWWLNTNQERIPAAPASVFWAAGFGGNYIYVDQENDLLVVMRWVPKLPEVVEKIMMALND